MSVSLVLLVVMAVLYACGVYLLLERSMTRVLFGFLLVGNATNLLILIVAGRPGAAPIYDEANELLYFLGSQVEIDCDEPQLAASRRERASAMLQTLSPRQFEVTRMVASGLLNKQIAAALGLSEKTIKMHRKLVMEKLELRTSADLIRVAVEAGI